MSCLNPTADTSFRPQGLNYKPAEINTDLTETGVFCEFCASLGDFDVVVPLFSTRIDVEAVSSGLGDEIGLDGLNLVAVRRDTYRCQFCGLAEEYTEVMNADISCRMGEIAERGRPTMN